MDERLFLQAEVGRLETRSSERISGGRFEGRRGLAEHHARVLRQTKARLAALGAAQGEARP
jgi:hypothetical protein